MSNAILEQNAAHEEAIALLSLLAELWPAAFKHEHENPVPLSIGIREVLQQELGGLVDDEVIAVALGLYCRRPAYHAALQAPGAVRVDLQGNAVGKVTAREVRFLKRGARPAGEFIRPAATAIAQMGR